MSYSQPKIVYLCPSYMTTAGHQSITSCINTIARTLFQWRSVQVVPVFDDPPYPVDTIRWITEISPELIIVDFPDLGIMNELVRIKPRVPSLFVYMGMCATQAGCSHFPYDLVINVEPDAHAASNAKNEVTVCPLVQLDRFHERVALQYKPQPTSVVWFESGTVDERDEMRRYLRSVHGTNLVESGVLPQPVTPLLRHFGRIISASGYSATWELNALGLFDITQWFTFERSLEDCARRVQFIRDHSAQALELGEGARAGLGLQQFAEIIRKLIDTRRADETVDWFNSYQNQIECRINR